jgi:hypothetical protein
MGPHFKTYSYLRLLALEEVRIMMVEMELRMVGPTTRSAQELVKLVED